MVVIVVEYRLESGVLVLENGVMVIVESLSGGDCGEFEWW